MNRLSITNRGIRVAFASLYILVLGLTLHDSMFSSVPIIFSIIVFYQYNKFRILSKTTNLIQVSPDILDTSCIAGSENIKPIQISHSLDQPLTLSIDYHHAYFEHSNIDSNDKSINLIHHPNLSGITKITEIGFSLSDRYGLFKITGIITVDFTLTAYPRVFPVALKAFEYINNIGQTDEGSQQSIMRRSGFEYAGSRDYVPGDPIMKFDWKAMARTNKPIVKEFFDEGHGGYSVIFDKTANDPVSLDELNHTFLQLVLSLVEEEESIHLETVEEKGLTISQILTPINALELSLQIVLDGQVDAFFQYYYLLNPGYVQVSEILVDKIRTSNPIINDYSNIIPADLIIVSSLAGSPKKLLDKINNQNYPRISMIQPSKPWLWEKSLEKSINQYKYYQKQEEIYQEMEIQIHYSVEELQHTQGLSHI